MLNERTPPGEQAGSLLRSFASVLAGRQWMETAAYVVLSLISALAGSLAAILLVPLVQPGHAPLLVGGMFALRGSAGQQALAFAITTVVFALSRWQAARLAAKLVGMYGMGLRRKVHARLIGAPLAALADASSAEIANILTYNVEMIVQGFSAGLQIIVVSITSAISLGFAFWVSPSLMLGVPVVAGVGLVASRLYGREQSRVSRQYVADMTRLFWHSEDFPRRLRHVRSFEREDAEKESYGAISARLCHGYQRQLELVADGRLMLELLASIGIALVLVAAHRWNGDDRSSLIAVCLLLGRLLPYLVSTRQSFQQLRSAAPAFELWRRYMRLDTSSSAAVVRTGTAVPEGALHIEHIGLKPPLHQLDIGELVLAPGELTLVSGNSGIGKSSLIDVLAGMMAPGSFKARFGKQPIDFRQYCTLVRRSAYVCQNVRPWQRSVRECLLWAAPHATDDLLQSVLVDVGLDKRLAMSPDGLDTALDDSSSKFSGGELQRLLLAQVILRRPFLALLDEATSALDAASEMMVLSAIKRRLPQTILVVVSHRPGVSTIANRCVPIGSDHVASYA